MPLGQGFLGRLGQGVQSFGQGLGQTMRDPLFQLGGNLLEQSGYSNMPRTFGQQLGGAFRQTGQDIMQVKQQEMQEKQFQQQLSEYEKKIKAQEAASKAREKFAELAADPNIEKSELARMAVSSPDDEIRKWGIGQIFPEQQALPEVAKIQQAYDQGMIPEEVYKSEMAKRHYIRPNQPLVQIGMGGLGQTAGGEQILGLGSIPSGQILYGTEKGPELRDIPGLASSKQREMAASFGSTDQLINNYEKMVDKHGAEYLGGILGTEEASRMQAAYTGIMMEAKNLFELGAITGPDMQILQSILTDPTSPEAIRKGRKGLKAQIGEVRKILDQKKKATGVKEAGPKEEAKPINTERVGQAIQLLKGQPGAAAELKQLRDEGLIPPEEYEAILKGLK